MHDVGECMGPEHDFNRKTSMARAPRQTSEPRSNSGIRHEPGVPFSMPSKIGELGAIGMPMAILANAGTATARYVTDFPVGELLTERERLPARLCEIITSVDERGRLSALARQYAERYLGQDKFRHEVLDGLRSAAFD